MTSTVPGDVVASFVAARKGRPAWAGVPDAHRPATIADGYAVQAAVYAALAAAGDQRVGWKVGSTSKESQASFGLSEPVYAGIFASTRLPTLAEALARPMISPRVECEIAVVLGSDLDATGAALSEDDVRAAIGACHIACEVIDNRYGKPLDVGIPSLLADDFLHADFVIGAANPNWASQDLKALAASVSVDGALHPGNTANGLSATDSMLWLASALARSGQRLRAGEIVLTGTIVPALPVTPPLRELVLSVEGFSPLSLAP